ncbi:cytochrome P450 [Amycolatopsis sp. NPDC021455]|uniref:cytochrome P450 n=1 Tax=Amycolatopsis sp. NPDC021455 TaxID=3154901 RepID=UPI0033C9AEA6
MSTDLGVTSLEPPALPGGLPVLGHTVAFGRDPVAFLVGAQEKVGDVFTVRIAGRKFTVLCGPAANDAVFRATDRTLGRRRAYESMTPLFGENILFDAPPEVFDEHMTMMLPALSGNAVSGYVEAMVQEIDRFLDGWGDAGTVDLPAAMSELSVNIAAGCLIGPEFGRLVGRDLVRLFDDLKAAGRLAWLVGPNLPIPAFRRRDRARRELVEVILSAARTIRQENPSGERFIVSLMESRYSDGRPLPEEVAASLLLAIIVAGEHNTAALAGWTGTLILQHPEVASAVVREQDALAAQGAGPDVHEMSALRKCVTEAERLYPPTTVLLRDAEEEFHYGGYRIARGSRLMISPAASHRLPGTFTEPGRYDPDRFSPERAEHRGTPSPLAAFGGGKHRCTGKAFAYQEIMLIWSRMLRRFDIELVDTVVRPDYAAPVAVPLSPCRIRYRRRTGPAGG